MERRTFERPHLSLPVLLSVLAVGFFASCASDAAEEDHQQLEVCGNGVLDPGEACDEGAANDDTVPGACRTDCTLPSCGDGVIDPGEGCDDGADNGGACSTECVLATCGDGVVDEGEACDEGEANSDTAPDGCRTDCTLPRCGDGVVDEGEVCDEGAANSDTAPDACRSTCQLSTCGDGVVDEGEACDEGEANSDTDPGACRTDCAPATCGDGIVDPGEACDDGAGNDDGAPDACRTDCTLPACGDGIVDSDEVCDDGDANSDSLPGACRTSCEPAGCGDGVVDEGEACDEGAANSDTTPDACRTSCELPTCGDGILDEGEACDGEVGVACADLEGFVGGTVICGESCEIDTTDCHGPEICGNGLDDDRNGMADCDDPACSVDLDLCPVCGDGLRSGDEACDGADLGGATCESAGFPLGGTIACSDECSLATTSCLREEICDNFLDDDGDGDFDCDDSDCAGEPDACPVCGDGVVSGGEECDDGNTAPGDGCDELCLEEPNICNTSPDIEAVGVVQPNGAIEVSGDTTGASNELTGVCTTASGPDAIYQLNLTGDADVMAKVGPPTGGTGVFSVYVREDCLDPATELVCSNDMITYGDPVAGLFIPEVTAGTTLYFTVDSTPTGTGDYTLSVIVVPILQAGEECDRFGNKDRCEDGLTCSQEAGTSPAKYICQ